MPLAIGERIGAYEVTGALGAGGMGEVYRARDSRLKRDVAIKTLPAAVVEDGERLVRFEREAQLLASLNHPNIAHLYGVEDCAYGRALVMELVPGDTLKETIDASRGLPLTQALTIARQIADALETAHEQGIVHRDLKPANVKVTPDGTVKLLDFGLAKVFGHEPDSDQRNSPTITAATRFGTILGTAAYMSPEQAVGKPADRRSDIWAFGVVVMEMLTGRPVFTGETASHVLAEVIKTEPDFSHLPVETPARIRRLLKRCLDKDRRRRIADASTLRLEIEEVLKGVDEAEPSARDNASGGARASDRWRGAWLPWTITVVSAAAAAGIWVTTRTPAPVVLSPARVLADAGLNLAYAVGAGPPVVISPDGTTLAITGRVRPLVPPSPARLYVRAIADLTPKELAGTEGAAGPFFSPDGKWIGFFAGGKLKKAAVDGTAVAVLCDAPGGAGGTWGEDGTIVMHADEGVFRSINLRAVSENGGEVREFSKTDRRALRWPQALPGGRGVLYTSGPVLMEATGEFNGAELVVRASPSAQPKTVYTGGYFGRYVSSGHLLFMRDDALFAVRFDLDRLEVNGAAAPVMTGIQTNANTGGAHFSASRDGTLVFTPGTGTAISQGAPILWFNRAGQTSTLRAVSSRWGTPAFSPDGTRLAMVIAPSGTASSDLWVYDWERDSLIRLTNDTALDTRPVWSPDGRRIIFGSTRGDNHAANLYWIRADGTGEVHRLTTTSESQLPDSMSGKWVAYHEGDIGGGPQRAMAIPLEGDDWTPGPPKLIYSGSATSLQAMLSPDGQWVAIGTIESGRGHVYVQPFSGGGDRVASSGIGAVAPVWSLHKPELVFAMPGTAAKPGVTIMSVPYSTAGGTFKPEKPREWSSARVTFPPIGIWGGPMPLHPDGERIAIASLAPAGPAAAPTVDHVGIVFGFFDELRRVARQP